MTQAQNVAELSSDINSSGVLLTAGGGTGLSTVGTNGQVLTSNGTTLSWATPSAGTSFQTSLSGLTPSTATTGTVTLAGTLGIASGGTGLTTLATGRVPYGAGTGALGSSANFVFDGTNLGIGTASPGSLLDVQGDITCTGVLQHGTNSIDIYNGDNMLFKAGYAGSYISFGTGTGATERMRIDSSGNVGIGTTSITKKLDVFSTTQRNQIAMSGSNVIAIRWNSTDPNAGERNWEIVNNVDAQGTLSFRAGTSQTADPTTTRMALDSSGNLQLSTGGTSILNSSGRRMLNQTGGILQVIQTVLSSATTLVSNGSPTNVSGLSATITPSSTSSRIYIILQIMYGSSGTTYGGYFTRNGTAIGQGDASGSRQRVQIGMALTTDSNQTNTFVGSYIDSPASTSALTYQFVAINDNGNTLYVNRSGNDTDGGTGKRAISTVTLMEIAG